MVSCVFTLIRKYNEIIRLVIPFVAVSMMNHLIWQERSSEDLFSNDTMFVPAIIFSVCSPFTLVEICLSQLFSYRRCHSRRIKNPIHFRTLFAYIFVVFQGSIAIRVFGFIAIICNTPPTAKMMFFPFKFRSLSFKYSTTPITSCFQFHQVPLLSALGCQSRTHESPVSSKFYVLRFATDGAFCPVL